MFDEFKLCYGTSKCIDIEGENDEVTMKALKHKSCELSKPRKLSQMPTKVSPWLGRLREKDGSLNVSFRSAKSRTKAKKKKKKR